jgi:hypothetical protein
LHIDFDVEASTAQYGTSHKEVVQARCSYVIVSTGSACGIGTLFAVFLSDAVFVFFSQLQAMSASKGVSSGPEADGEIEKLCAHRMRHIYCLISADKESARDRYFKLSELMRQWQMADELKESVERVKAKKRDIDGQPIEARATSSPLERAESLTAPELSLSTKLDIIAANRAKAMAKKIAKQQSDQGIFEAMQWFL